MLIKIPIPVNPILLNINYICIRLPCRLSSKTSSLPSTNQEKLVFISKSNDIYENLALEEWMYQNMDFTHKHILLMWSNNPCVVIGRNQNPWLEANTNYINNCKLLVENDQCKEIRTIQLARRNSGGGTVYHDRGNLNLTFFTPIQLYDRVYNLNIIKMALDRTFQIHVDISKRCDLLINDKKLSGTAAKLSRETAYHHCTVLLNVNRSNLKAALQPSLYDVKTNATRSIPSPTCNLHEFNSTITMDQLINACGAEYLRNSGNDGVPSMFHYITPSDQHYPGWSEIKLTFESWNWCYGKTPDFTVTQNFPVGTSAFAVNQHPNSLVMKLIVERGQINQIQLSGDNNFISTDMDFKRISNDIVTYLQGRKFTPKLLIDIKAKLIANNIDSTFSCNTI